MGIKRSRGNGERRIGRPPAGAGGAKVKDYPQLSIRLPVEVRAKLQALAIVTTRPQWRLITDAIECYLADRPERERRIVNDLVGGARTRRRRSGTPPQSHAGRLRRGRPPARRP